MHPIGTFALPVNIGRACLEVGEEVSESVRRYHLGVAEETVLGFLTNPNVATSCRDPEARNRAREAKRQPGDCPPV